MKTVTDRNAVILAIREYDELTRPAFLAKYGFSEAKRYFVKFDGKRYDSKAIYGAAFGFENPTLGHLTSGAFSGGERQVASRLRKLGFEIEVLAGKPKQPAPPEALVLVDQDATIGRKFDFWKDIPGVQYHFPNGYRNLVVPGTPFVYYRGVRRGNGRRGRPEYFGVGQIGEVWRDDENPAKNHWLCSIENYRPFSTPVAWELNGAKFESISRNQFQNGVRRISAAILAEICRLAAENVPARSLQELLPPIESTTLRKVAPGKTLLRASLSAAGATTPGQRSKTQPSRRSRSAGIIGERAELLVLNELRLRGVRSLRHDSKEGYTPGYDISYRRRGKLVGVEVKGTTATSFTSFELTEGERLTAEKMGETYELWLVSDVGKATAQYETITNPFKLMSEGALRASQLLWRIERTAPSK